MFTRIFAVISSITQGISTGGTGYIDGVQVKVPSKGIDSNNRSFFSLPLEVTTAVTLRNGKVDESQPERGTVTFFQRYSNDSGIWVTGGMDSGLAGGAIQTPAHERFIEETLLKVLKGKKVTVEVPVEFHGWTKMTVTLRLLQPKECFWKVSSSGASPAKIHSEKAQVLVYRT